MHGDDYFSAGPREGLNWLKKELSKASEIKSQHIGPHEDSVREGKVLNRIIRCTTKGYELEADARHAELIIEQMGEHARGTLTSPGIDTPEPEEGSPEKELLNKDEASLYRGIAARCNYLANDRPDLQFSVKEACREMSAPMKSSWNKLVRIAKYLRAHPRAVWEFDLQPMPTTMELYSDANWGLCRRTRKSTSGGAIRLGAHTLKTWSETQSIVAKSSGESEMYANVKASTESLGIVTLFNHLGLEVSARVHVDAPAAKSVIERQGVGSVRHIEMDTLWLQEQQARARLPPIKCPGEQNCADMMTKYLSPKDFWRYMNELNIHERDGRAKVNAQLHHATHVKNNKRQDCPDKPIIVHPNEEQERDVWECRGVGGIWKRRHNRSKLMLFTPFRVPRGPPRGVRLGMRRRTVGKFESGETFKIEDEWNTDETRHNMLEQGWTGYTEFYVDNSPEDDDHEEGRQDQMILRNP